MFINRCQRTNQRDYQKDIEIAKRYFKHITLNLYVNNTTAIKADEELKSWFLKEYKQLFQDPQFEILAK